MKFSRRTLLWISVFIMTGVAALMFLLGGPLVQWFINWLTSGHTERLVAMSPFDPLTLNISLFAGVALLAAAPFLAMSVLPNRAASICGLVIASLSAGVITVFLAFYYRYLVSVGMALSDSLVGPNSLWRVKDLPVLKILLPGTVITIAGAAVFSFVTSKRARQQHGE